MVYNATSVKSFYSRGDWRDGKGYVSRQIPQWVYWITLDGKELGFGGDMRAVAFSYAELFRERRMTLAVAATHDANMEFHYEKQWIWTEVLLCPWCGVRPDQWEMDCDGISPISNCGSDQCDKLNRCEGCGTDGTANHGTSGGKFCGSCYNKWFCKVHGCPCVTGGECRYSADIPF